jgi:hypothetical protein
LGIKSTFVEQMACQKRKELKMNWLGVKNKFNYDRNRTGMLEIVQLALHKKTGAFQRCSDKQSMAD